MEQGGLAAPGFTAMRDVIARRIRDEVLDGTLPLGARVPEKRYAETYGVSRTPVREAVAVLAAEGLVTLPPQTGPHVARPGPARLRQVFQVCFVLETAAVRFAEPEARAAALADLERLYAALLTAGPGGDPAGARGTAFHRRLVEAAANPAMDEAYRRVAGVAALARSRLGPAASGADCLDQRRAIVDALSSDDHAALEFAVAAHFEWCLGRLAAHPEIGRD